MVNKEYFAIKYCSSRPNPCVSGFGDAEYSLDMEYAEAAAVVDPAAAAAAAAAGVSVLSTDSRSAVLSQLLQD